MRNAHLATKDSTSRPENGRIEGGLSSEVIKMKDDSPLSGPGELDLAKLVDEVLGEMPGPGSAESGKMPLYQPNTLPLDMSPHAARLALEEAQRAKEKRRKEAEELGQMKTAAAPMEVLDLQRAAAGAAVVPGLAVQPAPKPASVVVAPAASAPAPASSKATAAPASSKKAEAKEVKPVQVRSAEVKDSAKATVLTTAKALEKRSSAGRWIMIGMGVVAVAAASTAGWLAYKKSPLLGHASAATATPTVTAPATTAAAPATPSAEGTVASGAAHPNGTPATAAPEAKPPATSEAKSEEPKPEAKAAAPEAKPAEAKTEEPAATPKPKRKVTTSAPEPKPAPEAKAEEPAPKPAPVAKAPEPKPAPVAKAPEPKPAAEAKPAAAPAQPSSVDAILQQQLKGAIP